MFNHDVCVGVKTNTNPPEALRDNLLFPLMYGQNGYQVSNRSCPLPGIFYQVFLES